MRENLVEKSKKTKWSFGENKKKTTEETYISKKITGSERNETGKKDLSHP